MALGHDPAWWEGWVGLLYLLREYENEKESL